MAELRREENTINTGLSTAALAHADEPVQHEIDERDVEYDRGDLNLNSNGTNLSAPRMNDANAANAAKESDEQTALFSADESNKLRGQWDSIQVGFVDEPRKAVENADALVAGAMKRLAEMFAAERERLEKQWDRGDSVSTEELRVALRRYRAFFGRLLSV